MLKNIKLKNAQIYKIMQGLNEYPLNDSEYIPVAYNFYIQKNIETISEAYSRIEKNRVNIVSAFGVQTDENTIQVPSEHRETVNKELSALSEIEQELQIYVFPIGTLKDLKLTTGELKSLMFMIEDDETFLKILFENSTVTTETINLE